MEWKKVTKEEFFKAMNPLDVHPAVRGEYASPDHCSEWRLRNRELIGKSVPVGKTPHYKPDTEYFLRERYVP